MEIIDIGANLTHESFVSDFEAVVADAKAVGLAHIMLTGTDLKSTQAALALTAEQPDFFSCTAGFHPHVATDADAESFHALSELAENDFVVAVGETGLDYNRDFSPRDVQIEVFERHLELAAKLQKPVFLHQREAHQDFLPLLQRYRSKLPGGVVHCFTDNEQALRDYLDLDMHVGITGWICDERRGQELQGLVGLIPDNRLLIETDAPYLLPRSLRPKPKSRRNEPRHLTEVLRVVAHCRDQSLESVAEFTCHNTRALFGIASQVASH